MSAIVKEEKNLPCGCHWTVMSDERTIVSPCPPCGLKAVAQGLMQASQALAAVATRLAADSGRIDLSQILPGDSGGSKKS